jgi:transcriptional regulator with XRE-family HTH domain
MVTTLKRLRLAKGLTQEELAAVSGVHHRHISQIERALIAAPQWPTVYRLAKALKVKPQELFPVEAP